MLEMQSSAVDCIAADKASKSSLPPNMVRIPSFLEVRKSSLRDLSVLVRMLQGSTQSG